MEARLKELEQRLGRLERADPLDAIVNEAAFVKQERPVTTAEFELFKEQVLNEVRAVGPARSFREFRDSINARMKALEKAPVKAWLWLRLVAAEGKTRRSVSRELGRRTDDLAGEVDRIGERLSSLYRKIVALESERTENGE